MFAKVDALSFWKKYRPKAFVVDKINAFTLLEGFRKLIGQSSPPIQLRIDHLAQVMEPPPNHILNTYITFTKLLQALKKLQRNKAAGLDGMKAKFILDVGELLHMPLLTTFNCFLEEGFPETLSTGMVHTFFKGGDASKFNNYKGITVGPILAKLFTMILEKRLREWVEQHRLRAKGQAGFRKDYRTIDQLFILRSLIKQSKAKKKPLYYCFVDFKKVFNIVPHEVLWHVLVGLGVEGRFLQCLQVMYAKDTVRINHPSEGVTSNFRCQQGVKQGCPFNPLLFGLYLDALEGHLDGRKCDVLALANVHVWLLHFVDDLVLTSESKVGLQQQLDMLQQFCDEHGFIVNVQKTKAMVFNFVDPCQEFMFKGDVIERVHTFKYLGILLETISNSDNVVEHLTTTSRCSLFAFNHHCAELRIMDVKLHYDLFNKLVHSTASYAYEVWVDSKKIKAIEVVYRGFFKSLLGV
jgi:hypothetical protein